MVNRRKTFPIYESLTNDQIKWLHYWRSGSAPLSVYESNWNHTGPKVFDVEKRMAIRDGLEPCILNNANDFLKGLLSHKLYDGWIECDPSIDLFEQFDTAVHYTRWKLGTIANLVRRWEALGNEPHDLRLFMTNIQIQFEDNQRQPLRNVLQTIQEWETSGTEAKWNLQFQNKQCDWNQLKQFILTKPHSITEDKILQGWHDQYSEYISKPTPMDNFEEYCKWVLFQEGYWRRTIRFGLEKPSIYIEFGISVYRNFQNLDPVTLKPLDLLHLHDWQKFQMYEQGTMLFARRKCSIDSKYGLGIVFRKNQNWLPNYRSLMSGYLNPLDPNYYLDPIKHVRKGLADPIVYKHWGKSTLGLRIPIHPITHKPLDLSIESDRWIFEWTLEGVGKWLQSIQPIPNKPTLEHIWDHFSKPIND